MTQDELKQQAALRALDYVIEGAIVGVGTGSTANFFIDGLATMKTTSPVPSPPLKSPHDAWPDTAFACST